MGGPLQSFRFPISPLEAVVLMHHVIHCEDAENDADRTVRELMSEIDDYDGYISKGVLESALYACNMQDEKKQFWHPFEHGFDRFVEELLPRRKKFNKYYHVIYDEKEEN